MNESEATSPIDVSFVLVRARELEGLWSERNLRMDDMEKLYTLDFWKGDLELNERRINSPRAFYVCEATRALLFTRRPVIEVPASLVENVAQTTADRIEKHLYGSWEQMGLLLVIHDVEFYATVLGGGVARVVYDPGTPVGEFPLCSQALDPRTYFYNEDPRRPLEDMEAVVSSRRTRRAIEAEWGPLSGTPEEGETREGWLDTLVDYYDYWCTRLVDVEVAEEETEPLGVLGQLAGALSRVLKIGEEEQEPGEREADAERETKLRRRVINCVVADGQIVKEPAILPGYERLPFFRWAGIRTPLEGKDSCLSVLYPIAGGARKNESQGIISAENELIGMSMRLSEQRAAPALVTNDEALGQIGGTPGEVTVASRQDFKIEWIVPPGEGPDLGAGLARLAQLAEDATLPSTMMGQYQAAASGVALSLITNPVLMRIASKQLDREDVLQAINKHILALTEEYAPNEGWPVYGRDVNEKELEERLEPSAIRGYRRNRVHLTARLPKDAPGEALMLRSLIDSKLLSRRAGVERIQQILDLAGQSPHDEMKQVLVESILFDDQDVREAMGERALAEYDAELAATVMEARMQTQQAMGPPGGPPTGGPPMPGGPPGPLAQGPMQGMPPGVVPPQAMPPALGLEQMQAMQQPPPGVPGG